MIDDLKPAPAALPLAPYIGGKRNLSEQISCLIAGIPHKRYAEVFVGMGGVFFRRTMMPEAEIINDRSRDVANLFRILQRHYQAFLDTIKWQLSSRADFERLMKTDPETLTDLERAARFLYVQRVCFGGKVANRVFGVAPGRPSRFDLTKLVPMLEEAHDRLSSVTIECLDYGDFIERYDDPETLFYLDPPYYECESDYGRDLFSRDEFPKMAAQLAGLKGKFILSLNDHPAVRDIFRDFKIRQVETAYSIAAGAPVRVQEVLISNDDGVMRYQQESMI